MANTAHKPNSGMDALACKVNAGPAYLMAAYLVAKMRELPKEAFDDLSSLMIQLTRCGGDAETIQDITDTVFEILFPELIGSIQHGKAGPAMPTEKLARRMKYIGTRIREERGRAGLTQKALAEKAGLLQSHISRLEAGQHSPSYKTLAKVAEALQLPVGKLDPSYD